MKEYKKGFFPGFFENDTIVIVSFRGSLIRIKEDNITVLRDCEKPGDLEMLKITLKNTKEEIFKFCKNLEKEDRWYSKIQNETFINTFGREYLGK